MKEASLTPADPSNKVSQHYYLFPSSLLTSSIICAKFHFVSLVAGTVETGSMKAERARHHPSAAVVALQGFSCVCVCVFRSSCPTDPTTCYHKKAGQMFQVRKTDDRTSLAVHSLDEDITYLRWVSDQLLALVTPSAVFHWSLADPTGAPRRVFDRAPELQSSMIVNYISNESHSNFFLVGLCRDAVFQTVMS